MVAAQQAKLSRPSIVSIAMFLHEKSATEQVRSGKNEGHPITKLFLYWICLFRFFVFILTDIILGGEGGYLDWFLIRLLARDPPGEVGSMQR